MKNETSNEVKFCVNCRHCWANNPPRKDAKEYQCNHPELYSLSLVTGLKEKKPDETFCYQLRAGRCGFVARWFEPIPKL